MQKNFTNDDFEEFLKRSADGLRMPPSDKVWAGIAQDLKKRRRRIGYFTSAFLLISSCLGYLLIQTTKELPKTDIAVTSPEPEENVQESATTYPTFNTEAKKPAAKVIKMNGPHALAINPEKQNFANANNRSISENQTNIAELPVILSTPSTDEGNNTFQATITDSEVTGEIQPAAKEKNTDTDNISERILSIESVTNAFRLSRHKIKRFSFQFSFTPTISYRKLSENKSYLRSLPPSSVAASSPNTQLDINNAVTHKPDIGLETGVNAKYQIAKSIKLRAGLQFNINRYDIKAFTAPREIATLALTTGANQVDFVEASANYRNFNGYKPDWLQNFYFQLSAPVGLEFRLFTNKNAHFGIAGTVQPTYLIGEKAYLLSSDYKNYTEVPWLARRWNVNTAFETYIAYSTGKMNWQVGPQVRYQLLSSYISKYPVKENLFDFGLKVGISLNKKGGDDQQK